MQVYIDGSHTPQAVAFDMVPPRPSRDRPVTVP